MILSSRQPLFRPCGAASALPCRSRHAHPWTCRTVEMDWAKPWPPSCDSTLACAHCHVPMPCHRPVAGRHVTMDELVRTNRPGSLHRPETTIWWGRGIVTDGCGRAEERVGRTAGKPEGCSLGKLGCSLSNSVLEGCSQHLGPCRSPRRGFKSPDLSGLAGPPSTTGNSTRRQCLECMPPAVRANVCAQSAGRRPKIRRECMPPRHSFSKCIYAGSSFTRGQNRKGTAQSPCILVT
jgi:hypothetical protein